MRENLEEILHEFNLKLLPKNNNPVTLHGGVGGKILLIILSSKYLNLLSENNNIEDELETIAELSFSMQNKTICNGKSGINWLFKYLCAEDFIDKQIMDIICSDEDSLSSEAISQIKSGNYDFLHGAIGIAYYLLYTPSNNNLFFFNEFFSILNEIKNENYGIIHNWDYETNEFNREEVNLGLAHGLPSILKFCIEAYKQNICIVQAKQLAESIVQEILNCQNKDTSFSFFASIYNNNIDSQKSRLAWCYGDLSLAFILYQYSKLFENQEIKTFALEVLRRTTFKRSYSETFVNDVGICHGSAGVAHIYNKMWYYTQEEIFKQACDYWIADIVKVWKKGDGEIFKKYSGATKQYEESNTLIEGYTGVGLVLLSYLTGDFSWDYCFMLND